MKAVVVAICAALVTCFLYGAQATALAPVLISQLQTGDTLAATNEAVELYNNTAIDQEVTNWCLRYVPALSPTVQSSPRYCFTPVDTQTKIFLSPHSYASLVTTGYVMPNGLSPDGRFSGSGMAATGGHIRLLDANAAVVDAIGWGTGIFAEGYSASLSLAPVAPTAQQALVRKASMPPFLQDSDNNQADFELKVPSMHTGGVFEVRVAQDLCGNLDGVQEVLPDGTGYDEAGDCELLSADLCLNIDDIQLIVPLAMMTDEAAGCYEDVCVNLVDLQQEVPAGYKKMGDACIALERRAILLSEIMPNAIGSDAGHEFIELYNPNDEAIDLEGYVLESGKEFSSKYVLEPVTISPLGYLVLSDDDLGFSLVNTGSTVRLTAPAGNQVSETSYVAAGDGVSWSLLPDGWAYTDTPTSGEANTPSQATLGDEDVDAPAVLSPCPSGKYRHPITNRCRNIESDSQLLASCDVDEYRNPETNRCRKVAVLAAALVPCRDGYERNAATNRCRKIGAETVSLKSCAAGQERNPATNRCRKVVEVPASASSPEKAIEKPVATTPFVATLVGVMGAGAVGYGVYEWRSELSGATRRLFARLGKK